MISAYYGILSDIVTSKKNHAERITQKDREFAKTLDFTGITFPVTLNQIPRIEKQNKIRIYVTGYEEKQRFPLYRSKKDYDNYIHLLYYEGKYNDEDRQHYAYIKKF